MATSEHADVARDLAEATARKEADAKFGETLNNPCPDVTGDGTTV